ncbi:MAG: MFS transporter [Chthoniobacteraceae bacterium]
MPSKPQSASVLEESGGGVPPVKTWSIGTLTYTSSGLIALFAWLLWGDFTWSLKERSIGQVLQILLMKFGASDVLTGFLLGSLPAGIAMFLCPVVGYRSDRHRGRWGRRIPFILLPTPIVVLAMIGLAYSPELGTWFHQVCGAHSLGLNGFTLLFLAFFWVMFAFSGVIINAVFGALINDVVPTAVLGRFYGAFRALSLAAGMLFSYWIFGQTEAHYAIIFIGIGLVFGGGLFLMCWKVKEGEYPPPPPAEPDKGVKGFYEATRGYMKACFGNSYYLLVFFVLAAPAIAFLPFNLFSIFYAKSIHMSMDEYGKCNAVMYLISFSLSYPIGMLADRVHPIRLSIIGLAAYGLICLWGGFFVRDTVTFIIALFGCGVVVGIWMTATASLPQRLLPAGKFAEYFSAAGIINCLSQIIIGPVLGVFLDSCGHVYRYVFFVGAGLTALCLWACVVLHRRFMMLGGPEHYVAPE